MSAILVALAVLGLWYIPPALALMQLEFQPVGFKFSGTSAQVDLRMINPTGTPLTIRRIAVDVFINETFITKIDLTGQARVPARGYSDIPIVFNINPEQIAETIYKGLQAADWRNLNITLRGAITERGKPYPINFDFNLSGL
jgi:LEA14-like dessication related protein